ncbi:Sodium/potassium/calcium exchanger 3, partial [Lamprotornis superbus]
ADGLGRSVAGGGEWSGRRLLQARGQNGTDGTEHGGQQLHVRNCTEPALHEFPNDIFTNEDRRRGAVVLHVLCAVLTPVAGACGDFSSILGLHKAFQVLLSAGSLALGVQFLQLLSVRLHLSEDVAGATFMAAGSSAPELFTSVIGVFITKGDVGVGTIVGSAVFNILCIIGVCGLFAGQVGAFNDPLQFLLHPVPWLCCRITCQVHNLATNFSGFVVFNRAQCCSSLTFEMKSRAAKVSSGFWSCPRLFSSVSHRS